MKDFLLEVLVCPSCGGKLVVSDARREGSEIESGSLACACGRRYPVRNGIPRFVDKDGYVSNFSFEWGLFSKTQLDSFNGTRISEDRFREVVGSGADNLKGKVVLEAGCGMGRFLEVAARYGAEAIGVDLSFSVDSARENLKKYPNVNLVQADMFNMPFAEGRFDLVYSIGVIHHTPRPKEAFLRLVPLLSRNGAIAIWITPRPKLSYLPRATQIARFFTTRMDSNMLIRIIKKAVPLGLPLVRLPLAGGVLKGWVIPICDYKGRLPLSEERLLEWSILDTFDLLSPRYLYSYTVKDVSGWVKEAGLSDMDTSSPEIIFRARRTERHERDIRRHDQQ
ncbi:MAG: methyltransferase domain-containing protein [Candidatus Omnitrophota bacterium]